jgi:hypothetical protein
MHSGFIVLLNFDIELILEDAETASFRFLFFFHFRVLGRKQLKTNPWEFKHIQRCSYHSYRAKYTKIPNDSL